MAQAKQLITNKTKIVSIAHVSNVLGVINPVKELGKLVHEQGGVLVVDGAQSAPHMPINVQELEMVISLRLADTKCVERLGSESYMANENG